MVEDKSVNVGQAAPYHSGGGGRQEYDASLTPDERRGPSNGIWLWRPPALSGVEDLLNSLAYNPKVSPKF
jgi:hypothetical protein